MKEPELEWEHELLDYAKERANQVEDISIDVLIQLVLDGADWMKDEMGYYE